MDRRAQFEQKWERVYAPGVGTSEEEPLQVRAFCGSVKRFVWAAFNFQPAEGGGGAGGGLATSLLTCAMRRSWREP